MSLVFKYIHNPGGDDGAGIMFLTAAGRIEISMVEDNTDPSIWESETFHNERFELENGDILLV
jgi:hypothetical protein